MSKKQNKTLFWTLPKAFVNCHVPACRTESFFLWFTLSAFDCVPLQWESADKTSHFVPCTVRRGSMIANLHKHISWLRCWSHIIDDSCFHNSIYLVAMVPNPGRLWATGNYILLDLRNIFLLAHFPSFFMYVPILRNNHPLQNIEYCFPDCVWFTGVSHCFQHFSASNKQLQVPNSLSCACFWPGNWTHNHPAVRQQYEAPQHRVARFNKHDLQKQQPIL